MNVFIRKMCILKQLKSGFSSDGRFLSGVVKAEFYGGSVKAEVSLINFAPLSAGNYCCVLCDKRGETVSFPITESGGSYSASGKMDITDGFLAVVCYVDFSDYAAVACGVNGDNIYDTGALLFKLFGAKKNVAPVAAETKEKREESPNPEGGDKKKSAAKAPLYDDGKISEENYYGFSPSEEKEDNMESSSMLRLFKISGGDTYYKSVRSKLDEVFRSSQRDETLRSIFPHSVWVKNKTGELVGVITEQMAVKYICCAVRADGNERRRINKPGCYVPVSYFGKAENYFVAFQDADTGEYINVEES